MKMVFLIIGMIMIFNILSCNIETNKQTKVIVDTTYVCDKVIITDEGQLLLYKDGEIKWIIKQDEYTIEQ
jgi:hypothetical protein